MDENVTWDKRPLVKGESTGVVEILNDEAMYECDVASAIKNWAARKNSYGIMLSVREAAGLTFSGKKAVNED